MFWKNTQTETARLDAERNAQARAHAENYVPPVKRIGDFVGIGDHACRASEIEEIGFSGYEFDGDTGGFDLVVIGFRSHFRFSMPEEVSKMAAVNALEKMERANPGKAALWMGSAKEELEK